jgi:threonyl-tRNA synthetase
LQDKGFRVEYDLRNEKIGFKIREHTLQKVPYLLVVGDREVEARAVAARDRSGNDLGTFALDDFSAKLGREVADRTH